jgi:hypothetical protein
MVRTALAYGFADDMEQQTAWLVTIPTRPKPSNNCQFNHKLSKALISLDINQSSSKTQSNPRRKEIQRRRNNQMNKLNKEKLKKKNELLIQHRIFFNPFVNFFFFSKEGVGFHLNEGCHDV